MIAIVLGTRAELIKMFPVMKELDKRKIKWEWIHTGQHNLDSLIEDFEIKRPKIVLDVPISSSGRFKGGKFVAVLNAILWSLKITNKIEKALKKLKAKFVLCQGDTMATAATVLAVRSILFKRPKVGHIEAGIRSFNLFEPFPEEISRRISDFFSDFLFAPTEKAVENLKKEKIKGKVYLTGNTIVDAVREIISSLDLTFPEGIKAENYVIAQTHRYENITSPERLGKFVEIVTELPHNVVLIMPENTEAKLKEFDLWNDLQKKNIQISSLKNYKDFLRLLHYSSGIITDSGGVMEECSILGKPCLVFRKRTERPEAIEAGVAELIMEKESDFVVNFLKRKLRNTENIFGDGKASKRIIDVVVNKIHNNLN